MEVSLVARCPKYHKTPRAIALMDGIHPSQVKIQNRTERIEDDSRSYICLTIPPIPPAFTYGLHLHILTNKDLLVAEYLEGCRLFCV